MALSTLGHTLSHLFLVLHKLNLHAYTLIHIPLHSPAYSFIRYRPTCVLTLIKRNHLCTLSLMLTAMCAYTHSYLCICTFIRAHALSHLLLHTHTSLICINIQLHRCLHTPILDLVGADGPGSHPGQEIRVLQEAGWWGDGVS